MHFLLYSRPIVDYLQLLPASKLSNITNLIVEIGNIRNGLNSRINSAEQLADEAEEFI